MCKLIILNVNCESNMPDELPDGFIVNLEITTVRRIQHLASLVTELGVFSMLLEATCGEYFDKSTAENLLEHYPIEQLSEILVAAENAQGVELEVTGIEIERNQFRFTATPTRFEADERPEKLFSDWVPLEELQSDRNYLPITL
ncbi:hypothetical protein [Vibrio sp.]|uniref:hypothetical protein n=1 Tax=Vibrio sp. TaxID=678 RepID=UPI003D125397